MGSDSRNSPPALLSSLQAPRCPIILDDGSISFYSQ